MKFEVWFVVACELGLLAYAIWAVHHRIDRRKIPHNFASALHGSGLFAVVALGVSVFLAEAAGARKFVAVREIFEIAMLSSTLSVALALRIMKGAPYDRDKKENPP